MNSKTKTFIPFTRSLLVFSLFADDETEPPKSVLDSPEAKASKVCGG